MLLQLSVREAWTWQHLNHPNIIPFLGIADYMTVCPGALPQLCLVSPWMEAGNVMEYIALHPVANRLPFLLDIVNGVEYLHTFPPGPIIHGDLKGNNILVDTGGKRPVARICDFGLAQVLESTMKDGLSTTSTAFEGNARWKAPERLVPERYGLGQLESKSIKSDVFEMMRTFLQILTGKPPFFDTSDLAAAVAAMQGMIPEYPSVYCHGLDSDRVNLMRQAWSTNREERPSLTDIRRDLEQSLFLDKLLVRPPFRPSAA
ncbi:kinase-like protein [Calocera viscosa TUFC12733]|uniref:Kinase-like protein n=1 Tax=Calocera viscosa (strain TUFC12733) TaxID=1330018 RepID=A0A167IBF9_CALVF|nr:kinase-like protein [Calocera viscosa TUFC12733]